MKLNTKKKKKEQGIIKMKLKVIQTLGGKKKKNISKISYRSKPS